ncbi:90 kDa surface protein [Trypanosoma cruzi]|uniref:90 kDa surface protein, putative n=1 Tax=Trypanosoma cruzi (strain CL Brener) TaxID=353153 RepID=Q4E508_TRYCC|nr:90 kDa surface protein, putative [Trypanosoma cruzi]EAN99872.1 90 kDa surface protein, putative [Trypanosoma cruzi]RNC41001.1 90 kDa surface protein [Trypanosoma cruzi]|eukprot:XP_821723.1 90 kDa surface protein [Trypanosoma cruzi strain CL Brener]
MRRVFCVLLVLALLCCCSCVFAVEEVEEQEPQVTQVNAECAGDGNVARWQLPGNSLWYNCTVEDNGVGKEICGMGGGNCTSEASQSRAKGVAKGGVFTINVTSPTPSAVKSWWESNVKSKAVTVESVAAKPPEGPPSPPDEKISRETFSRPDSESFPDGAENSADVPPSPPPATPGGAGANPVAGAAATTDPSAAALGALDSAPSGDPQGPSHSASAASPAPESPPDPKPTEGGGHSSHEPPVELREETAAAPPTQLSQTGEDGGAAEGTEEDTAANATDTASGEGNATAAGMSAPLSSAPTTNALENSVGTDACFHGTHLNALPLLFLAVLAYGTLG